MSSYDPIAELYDPWSASVTEDVAFYVAEARKSGGPVIELGVGTGRIAIPVAAAGIRVTGVDSSAGMLEVCRRKAAAAGVEELIDLRQGDLRSPPAEGPVPLVLCPFRSLLHLDTDEGRLAALGAARDLLSPGGRLVFDVFAPSMADVNETDGRWLEREPGIWERADWDLETRTLALGVRGEAAVTTMRLSWLTPGEWRNLIERAGLEPVACYGWFDLRPYAGGEDQIWVARRPG
jgi:SAM-dependent methyltransferase